MWTFNDEMTACTAKSRFECSPLAGANMMLHAAAADRPLRPLDGEVREVGLNSSGDIGARRVRADALSPPVIQHTACHTGFVNMKHALGNFGLGCALPAAAAAKRAGEGRQNQHVITHANSAPDSAAAGRSSGSSGSPGSSFPGVASSQQMKPSSQQMMLAAAGTHTYTHTHTHTQMMLRTRAAAGYIYIYIYHIYHIYSLAGEAGARHTVMVGIFGVCAVAFAVTVAPPRADGTGMPMSSRSLLLLSRSLLPLH